MSAETTPSKGALAYLTTATCIASLSFGFNIGVVNQAADYFDKCTTEDATWNCFPVSKRAWGVMSSMMCVGALLGSLAAGHLADTQGRLRALNITSGVYIAGLLLFGFAISYWMLLLGRTLVGVGVGLACVIVPMYLNEASPVRWRGTVVFGHQLAIVTGIVLVEALALVFGVSDGNWRWIVLLNLSLQVIQLILLLGCKESSSWHSHRTRRITNDSETVDTIIPSKPEQSYTERLFSKEARRSLFVAVFLHFAQQVSGINGIFFFSASLFPASPYVPVLIALLNLIMSFISMSLIEKLGRRPLLLGSLTGMVISSLSLYISTNSTFSALMILCFVATFAAGLGPVPWVAMSELFPSSTVGTFLPLAVSTNWIMNMIVAAVFLPLHNYLGNDGLFLLMGLICTALLVVSFLFVQETKGRPAGYLN